MKLKKYLTESLSSKSKRELLSIIHNLPKGKSKLSIDGNDVEVSGDGKSATFKYPSNAALITMSLVDIIDTIPGRTFDYKDKGGKTNFIVKGI